MSICDRARAGSIYLLFPAIALMPGRVLGQQSLTWEQIETRFEANNPTLLASQASVDESRASEITAYLRPNPDVSLSLDGFQVSPNGGIWRPLSGVVETPGISYLHERDRKRELRRDSARESTRIAESTYEDQKRTLLFNLRSAFVQVLQAKAVLANAKENLDYWDKELEVNRTRFNAGDLAQDDLERLELQRFQFESDYQNAVVNLRTNKIQLLMLLNDSRTPIDQFDVTGTFDFKDQLMPLEQFRQVALDSRPDLKAAMQTVDLANVNHRLAISNGSTDPTFSAWYSHNPSFANPFANNTVGGSVSIPLRIFDRNQGEKARTQIDIQRSEKLRDAAQAQVFSDVDSAYATLETTLNLLRTRSRYVQLATDVRDKISFSYQHGGASLLDYLDAEKSFRDTRLAYLNLVGSYLTAAAQMNMAAGREVLP